MITWPLFGVGLFVGDLTGLFVGLSVGVVTGLFVGLFVGVVTGLPVGLAVGRGVGSGVTGAVGHAVTYVLGLLTYPPAPLSYFFHVPVVHISISVLAQYPYTPPE